MHRAVRIPGTIRLVDFALVTRSPRRFFLETGRVHLLSDHGRGQAAQRLDELTALLQIDRALVLYEEVKKRDPHDNAARFGEAFVQARYGDAAAGRSASAASDMRSLTACSSR